MNKFLTYKDEINPDIAALLPVEWWSRPYEYTFAIKQVTKSGVVVDAGCGIEHPFKWLLSDKCKKVYAIDSDARILEMGETIEGVPISKEVYQKAKPYRGKDNIEYLNMDIKDAKLSNIDTVFCISVLEHLPAADIKATLTAFMEWLKPGGKVILTVDYPTIKPEILLDMVLELGFLVGTTQYDPDDKLNIVTQEYQTIKVYTLVATKPKPKPEPKKDDVK